jgi:calcineurin-like phosphoesterase family protein
MSTFITADPHWGHKNIIKYTKRPFNNVTEMDETLIKNWNSVVQPNDEIHVVGDVAFCCSMDYALGVMKRLNGTKHLVVGNHDQLALGMNDIRPGTWKTIKEMNEIIIHNQKIVLCHYPIAEGHWHHAYKGTWMLYGHVHGTFQNSGKSLDVGVDCWNYTPASFWNIKKKMDEIPNPFVIDKKDEWDKSDRKE